MAERSTWSGELGLEIEAYDKAPCPPGVLRALRRPVQRVLGPGGGLAHWNDNVCQGQAAAERLLRAAAAQVYP